jgi:hypothetical protein
MAGNIEVWLGSSKLIYFGGYPKMMSLVDTNFPVAVHLLSIYPGALGFHVTSIRHT